MGVSMVEPQTKQTGVSIVPEFHLNQFLLRTMKISVKIDRRVSIFPWGPAFVETRPGHHEVEIGIRSWGRVAGKNHISIDIDRGKTVSLVYRTRWWAFLPGTISMVEN
jgi:hypothetical protein